MAPMRLWKRRGVTLKTLLFHDVNQMEKTTFARLRLERNRVHFIKLGRLRSENSMTLELVRCMLNLSSSYLILLLHSYIITHLITPI